MVIILVILNHNRWKCQCIRYMCIYSHAFFRNLLRRTSIESTHSPLIESFNRFGPNVCVGSHTCEGCLLNVAVVCDHIQGCEESIRTRCESMPLPFIIWCQLMHVWANFLRPTCPTWVSGVSWQNVTTTADTHKKHVHEHVVPDCVRDTRPPDTRRDWRTNRTIHSTWKLMKSIHLPTQ